MNIFKKNIFVIIIFLFFIFIGAVIFSKSTIFSNKEIPQIGLNFIRFYWEDGDSGWSNPDVIFDDFDKLGIETFRQLIKADLHWNIIEPQNNEWNFEQADEVLMRNNQDPIVTLFSIQYASATEPWVTDPNNFKKQLSKEGREYVETVVTRYADHVRFWEIGNEMDHWRTDKPDGYDTSKLPKPYPANEFTPEEQGIFLAEVAEIIRQNDPDAIIILPGMSAIDNYTLGEWLPGVIKNGHNWFDVVNYHYYGDWQNFSQARLKLDQTLIKLGIDDKPVWLTETGSTSSRSLNMRTDYPNSQESQAADIFRRIIQSYGHGDELVLWHTYVSSQDINTNEWRAYGLRDEYGEAKLSINTLKLFIDELIPFDNIEIINNNSDGPNIYKITTKNNGIKYVAWGSGYYQIPKNISTLINVVQDDHGLFKTRDISEGMTIHLKKAPILLK